MGIFGNIFRGEELKNRKLEFEKLKNQIERKGDSISSDTIMLFGLRKESVRIIQRVKAYIDILENCPSGIERGIAKALSLTENFRETMQWEIDPMQGFNDPAEYASGSMGVNVGIGGVAAGTAIATMGPTAAMAFATTFGTASTGAAISSLGGIAATNAALAWLGGGAIAAGGAGMAGGSAILALAGPIGWSLAGVAALGTTYKIRKSNTEAIDELDKLIKLLNSKLSILKLKHQKLQRLVSSTKDLNDRVSLDVFLAYPNDYASENFPKDYLSDIVNICKTMGKMINETIAMEVM